MPFYCYMVECVDGTYYTGWSTDPDRRVKVHNAGRGARYTSQRRPVRLVYVETVESLSAALKRERRLKTYDHRQKKKLVDEYQDQSCRSGTVEMEQ
ncbi:MAG: GIY-YIG nuclease family protein [Leptolinea sp.]|nr:GIY-YIG nuclease family protein [Leptolinea sp.]